MSHLADIPEYRCRTCKRRATYALINDRSAEIGHYCKPCGKKALSNFRAEQQGRASVGPKEGPKGYYVGPYATKGEAEDAAAAMRKAGL